MTERRLTCVIAFSSRGDSARVCSGDAYRGLQLRGQMLSRAVLMTCRMRVGAAAGVLVGAGAALRTNRRGASLKHHTRSMFRDDDKHPSCLQAGQRERLPRALCRVSCEHCHR